MSLKLGLVMGIGTNTYSVDMDSVKEAENLGFDSIWTSEAWGGGYVLYTPLLKSPKMLQFR